MKTITVSSPRPREGKTTSTIYLGTTMANAGQRVLIIDTDLRRPRLYKSLGVSREVGITNLIVGDANIDDVIKTTDIPNLYVLPSGPRPPNPAELLLTNKFKQVLEELEGRFDRILLDSPPLLAVTDAVVLARLSDGVIMVAQAGKSSIDDAAQSGERILEASVFDGGDEADAVYDTATVIRSGEEGRPGAPPLEREGLSALPDATDRTAWRLVISYFESGGDGGESVPDYELTFTMLDNGISYDVAFDYGAFTLAGELTELTLGSIPDCPDE